MRKRSDGLFPKRSTPSPSSSFDALNINEEETIVAEHGGISGEAKKPKEESEGSDSDDDDSAEIIYGDTDGGAYEGDVRTRSDVGKKKETFNAVMEQERREKRSKSAPVISSDNSKRSAEEGDGGGGVVAAAKEEEEEEEEEVPIERIQSSRKITVFKRNENAMLEIRARKQFLNAISLDASSPSQSKGRRDSVFQRLRNSTEQVIRSKQMAELKHAEEEATHAIRGLPTLEFKVIKIHHLLRSFKKQKRNLVLTTDGVENWRRNGKRTRVFPYTAIRQVLVIDSKTFMLSYDNSHNFFYRTPLAIQITNVISSRASKSTHVDRLRLDYEIAKRFQRKVSTMTLRSFKVVTSSSTLSQAEKMLWSQMEKLCSKKKSIEGKTISEFIKNFSLLEKNPPTAAQTTRHFLTGLREYIIEKRHAQVARLLRVAKIDSPRDSLIQDMNVASVVEVTLERLLLRELASRLKACFPRDEQAERLERYKQNHLQLVTKSQSYFDIEESKQCPEGWAQAITVMNGLDTARSPQEKIMTVMRAVQAIYLSHQNRLSPNANPQSGTPQSGGDLQPLNFISADEFLPILIYIILHSTIKDPVFTGEYLCEFCDSGLEPESLYYMTTFSSAAYYVETWDPEIEAQYLKDHQDE